MASHIKQTVMIGPHRLILGDAYRVLPEFGWFDALVTDPPYVLATSGGGRYRKQRKMLDTIETEGLSRGFDVSILSWKYARAIICFCSNDQLFEVGMRLRQGFHRTVVCQWHKTNPQPVANKHYRPDTEFYVHAWQQGFHPQGDLADKARFLLSPVGKSSYDHPTVKPDAVMNKIITNVAGRDICDPFMGTGSTGVAAIRAGRIFTGIENSKKYFKTAVRRITQAYAGAA